MGDVFDANQVLLDKVIALEEDNAKLHEVADGWKFRAQKAEEEAAKLREVLEKRIEMNVFARAYAMSLAKEEMEGE